MPPPLEKIKQASQAVWYNKGQAILAMSHFIILIGQVVGLVALSAICSGLNISLMALQPSDLQRKAKLGDKQAKRILPLRNNSHLVLTSIIITNVAVISVTSLVLDQHLAGILAAALSTLLIVIFGEVIPQALFVQNALPLTATFAPLLRLMIIATYPISKPLQLLLDRLIPANAPQLHSRNELGFIIHEHLGNPNTQLDEDEITIIQSVLQLSQQRVADIMTDIGQVFWLTPDYVINAQTISDIKNQGRSRVPIFDQQLTRCYGVLLLKDLVAHDFSTQQQPVSHWRLHPVKPVGSMTALDTMFRKFIAARTHLIPVERDDKIIGIVTIEDLIEEIIDHEIEDETDRHKHGS
jgi:metal transporter CNNM